MINIFKQGGIHIKPSKRGSFTDYCGGKVTEECIRKGKNSPLASIRKKATFAQNARKWVKKGAEGLEFYNSTYLPNTSRPEYKDYSDLFLDPFDNRLLASEEYKTTSENLIRGKENPNLILREPIRQAEAEVTKQETPEINNSEMYTYLIEKYGFTPIMAMATLKIAKKESGLKPLAENKAEKQRYGGYNYGFGLFQWTGSRNKAIHDWAQSAGLDLSDWKTQLDYFVMEASQRKPFMNQFRQATTIKQAVDLMQRGFENGSNTSLASVDDMNRIYDKSHQTLYGKGYDYETNLQKIVDLKI